MYEDDPDDLPVPQEMLQLDIYESLEDVTRHFTQDGVQQGNSDHANNVEDVTESNDEIAQNEVENSLFGLHNVDTIDQMSAFFDDAYWALSAFDGAPEVIASPAKEDQKSSGEHDLPVNGEQVTDGLDLLDYDTVITFNRQFDLDDHANVHGQVDLNQHVNLDDQVNVNQQVSVDQQIDLTGEADLNHSIRLEPQLEKPTVTDGEQFEPEELLDLVTTNPPVNNLHIPDGSPYTPATEQGEHSLGSIKSKHGAQKKKAVVRNTVTETSEPTRGPTRSPQQYAGVKKTKSPKGKVIGAAALDHMERLANQPDPTARAPEQAPIAQGSVDGRVEITLAHFLTEETLQQIKSVAQEIAREEAKRVYSREINSSLSKAYAKHLESKLRQQQILLQEAYSGGRDLQHQGHQMMEVPSLISQDVSLNTPGLSQPSHSLAPQGIQSNTYTSPQNNVMAAPNPSQSLGQAVSNMSPTSHHQANIGQAPAMLQMNGLSFPQQNGQLTGLTFAHQHGQMNGTGLVQNVPQFAQMGHQAQIQFGQQIQIQHSPQVSPEQQLYYQNLQPQPHQFYNALAPLQQATYQPQNQAQLVAQQYRAQQHNNQMQQNGGHQMQLVQPNQQAARAQRGKRAKQRQSAQ